MKVFFLLIMLLFLLRTNYSTAQDLKYVGGTFPTKFIHDTVTFNTFFQFHKLFFAANNQRDMKYIDTLLYKSDSTAVSGTLRIIMWSAIVPDTLIHSATLYYTYNQGILQKSSAEKYCYTAHYKNGGKLVVDPNDSKCYGPYTIKPPASISEKRICRVEE